MAKRALASGLTGQDGSYLAEHLLDRGFEVHGIVRRHSVAEEQDARLRHLAGKVQLHYGDLLDVFSLQRIVREVQPDWVFNLASQSHVRVSFDVPSFTIQTNALGVLNILEVCRNLVPKTRFYQASSSECFGTSVDPDGYQRETTPMHPTSPYGCAKLLGFSITRHVRAAYGMFAVNGILYNHSSRRRGSNFVEKKIVKGAVEISRGRRDQLALGNLDSYRDFGHSQDYTAAMIRMLEHHEPDDFVIATGETHSVREIVAYVFGQLGLDPEKYVVQDPRLLRPQELPYLRGDASKARTVLGWKPQYTFEALLDDLIAGELEPRQPCAESTPS